MIAEFFSHELDHNSTIDGLLAMQRHALFGRALISTLLLFTTELAVAHPGHGSHHKSSAPARTARMWTLANTGNRIEGLFVSATSDCVRIRRADATIVSIQRDALSHADQLWVTARMLQIEALKTRRCWLKTTTQVERSQRALNRSTLPQSSDISSTSKTSWGCAGIVTIFTWNPMGCPTTK